MFSLWFMLPAGAQSLEGVVTDNDGGTLPAVMVINKAKNLNTMTDVDGKYAIRADKGDEVEFTYMGYYPLSLQMPEGGNDFARSACRRSFFHWKK